MKKASLQHALDYLPRWLEFQMRQSEQPGCVVAVAHRGQVVLEKALGYANAARKTKLTRRHRFRVASHSKSFTAAAVMKLREKDALRLDDPVGRYVSGLDRAVADATIAQLLSHSAGLVRDGLDCGQWTDQRPFLSREEILADLAHGPIIDRNTRFKYSNHGFGLAGLVIEAVVEEPYGDWIQREIVTAAGLKETFPDVPIPPGTELASGHTAKHPVGRRLIIPGDNCTHGLAPATGFVSTARDLVRFYSRLDPAARGGILQKDSRREMTRRHWTEEGSSAERHYGLGIISGKIGEWHWFGHSGGFQGFITRTIVLPKPEVTISVLTNAADGMAGSWMEGAVHILQAYEKRGAPQRKVSGWTGRWCNLWGTVDFLPAGDRVLLASPGQLNPLADAGIVKVLGRDRGQIESDGGFGNHGEEVRLERTPKGAVRSVIHAGTKLVSERKHKADLQRRYRKR